MRSWLIPSCKLYRNQADSFYAANAWTDISEKLKIKFTWISSLHNAFLDKTYQCLTKPYVDLITNLNFVKMQHYRWMDCTWTFHHQKVGRFVGPQAAQAWSGWAMLKRGRSLLGQSSRYLAMMTRPILTKLFKARSMIVILIPVYDILILS